MRLDLPEVKYGAILHTTNRQSRRQLPRSSVFIDFSCSFLTSQCRETKWPCFLAHHASRPK